MADIALTVTYFAFLLGFGVIIANLLKKRNIPDTFFLLILGLVLGPTIWGSGLVSGFLNVSLVDVNVMGAIPDFLRILALIMVVFTGTFHLSFRVFKRYSDVSVKLAFVGVIFNTMLFGLVASFMFQLELVYALLLGAILSGTGTGVLFAFEGVLSKCKKAITTIKVESIFNSPLTVLLPILFLDLVYLEPGALIEPMKYMAIFWQMVAAGVGTGLIVGFAITKLLRSMLKEYTPLLVFAVAIITYALAESIGGSGMLAVAICGLIAGNMISKEREQISSFDDQLSEMLRISVFTLLGAQVTLPLSGNLILFSLIFFLIIYFSRPVFLMTTMGKIKKKFSRRDLILMNFVAPRGLSAAAMAPIVAATILAVPNLGNASAVASLIVNLIFLVILYSVLFSTIVGWVISRPRFDHLDVKREKSIRKKKDKIEQEMEDIEKEHIGKG